METIEIWGGPSTLRRVYDLIFGVVLRGARPAVQIDLMEVKPGVLMEDDEFRVVAFPVTHRGADSFGYTFERKARRPFLNEKAEELGVPQGPGRRDLVNGIPITLPDGRVIEPDEVLGEAVTGDKICITGDVANVEELKEPVANADLLVSEATYMHYEVDLARRFGHITAREAAELAQSTGVEHLLLTHLSRRYRERDIMAEAQSVFPQSTVVRDFDHFRVRHGEPLEKVEE
jgi:ribonuclease Z